MKIQMSSVRRSGGETTWNCLVCDQFLIIIGEHGLKSLLGILLIPVRGIMAQLLFTSQGLRISTRATRCFGVWKTAVSKGPGKEGRTQTRPRRPPVAGGERTRLRDPDCIVPPGRLTPLLAGGRGPHSRHVWEEGLVLFVTGSQGSYGVQGASPGQRIIWPKVSITPGLRNAAF